MIWRRAALAGRQESGKSVPAFGAASCRPIEQGKDSDDIRFVLYEEARRFSPTIHCGVLGHRDSVYLPVLE